MVSHKPRVTSGSQQWPEYLCDASYWLPNVWIWRCGILQPMESKADRNLWQSKLSFSSCLYIKTRQIILAWVSESLSHRQRLSEGEVTLLPQGENIFWLGSLKWTDEVWPAGSGNIDVSTYIVLCGFACLRPVFSNDIGLGNMTRHEY